MLHKQTVQRCGLLSLDDIKNSMNKEVDEKRHIFLPPLNIEVTNSAKESTDTALEQQLQKVLAKIQNKTRSAPVKATIIFSVTFLASKVI